MDDKEGTKDLYTVVSELMNDESYKPARLVNDVHTDGLDPAQVHHTRSPKDVKEEINKLRKELTACTGNYERSGQHDPDK